MNHFKGQPFQKDVVIVSVVYYLNNVHNAEYEMLRTRRFAQKLKGHYLNGKDEVFAHHIIQSFPSDAKITKEQAHEIGEKMMLQFTEGKHEFVIATHVDREHIHNVRPDRVLSQVV